MIDSIFYGLTVVVAYWIFLKGTKARMAPEVAGVITRLTVAGMAIFWPLTVIVAAALVVLGIIRAPGKQIIHIDDSAPRALTWILARPSCPVILYDVNGEHMMKAREAASKIRGGVSPEQFDVWIDGGWEEMADQEVTV